MSEPENPEEPRDGGTPLVPRSNAHLSPATGRLADQVAAELAGRAGSPALAEREGLRALCCAHFDGWIDNHVMRWVRELIGVDYEVYALGHAETLARLRQERFDLLLINPLWAHKEEDLSLDWPDNCIARSHELCAAAKGLCPTLPIVVLMRGSTSRRFSALESGPPATPSWDAALMVREDYARAVDDRVMSALRRVLGRREPPR